MTPKKPAATALDTFTALPHRESRRSDRGHFCVAGLLALLAEEPGMVNHSEEWLRQAANVLAGALFVFVLSAGVQMHTVTISGAPSWTDSVGALSTLGLLVVSIIAGLIAYWQLAESKSRERRRMTMTLVNKFFVPLGSLPSPFDAMSALLDMPVHDKSLEGATKEVLKAYANKLAGYQTALTNYFDEARDMYKRDYIERDYFLSRNGNFISTALGLFKLWKGVLPEREPALIESLKAMLKDCKESPLDYTTL